MEALYNYIGLLLFGFLFGFRKNYISNSFIFILWNFIGVFLHELSHFIVALILGGKPLVPYLIPHKEKFYRNGIEYEYWVLGAVLSRNINFFNAFYIGLAPLIVLVPISFYVYIHWFSWFQDSSLINYLLFYITEFIILYNAMPSTQDLKVASYGWLGLIFFILFAFALYFLYIKGYISGNFIKFLYLE